MQMTRIKGHIKVTSMETLINGKKLDYHDFHKKWNHLQISMHPHILSILERFFLIYHFLLRTDFEPIR